MQIFEITTHQPVTEISFKDIGRSVGKALIQAPVKALGNKVGADLIGDEKTKSATELMYDMQKYFGIATQQLYRGMPEHIIMSELIGKHGASQEQAKKALEAAQQQLQPGSQAISQPDSQAGSQAFGTMANQLSQAGATPAATTTPPAPAPAPASTTPSAPQSPEEIRKAKQAVATQAAQKNMTANSTPVPVAPTSTSVATTPNYSAATGPGVRPQTSVSPSSITGTSAVPGQQKSVPVPNYALGVGPGVKPQMTATPKIKAPTATTVPAKQKSVAVAESLVWSQTFDPSRTLLKKIKQL